MSDFAIDDWVSAIVKFRSRQWHSHYSPLSLPLLILTSFSMASSAVILLVNCLSSAIDCWCGGLRLLLSNVFQLYFLLCTPLKCTRNTLSSSGRLSRQQVSQQRPSRIWYSSLSWTAELLVCSSLLCLTADCWRNQSILYCAVLVLYIRVP